MGYGMYYDQILNGYGLTIIGANPPYQETFTVSNSGWERRQCRPDQPVPTEFGHRSGLDCRTSIRAWQPNWKDPYMQHWSVEVQHMLGDGGKTMFSVDTLVRRVRT
jgi:hypothetical protein